MKKKRKVLIFTDLDGTLLDADDYSFDQALPALEEIRKREIPLVLCSSKTRAELELYRREMKIGDPFISENGGAIFIPRGYFRKVPGKPKMRGEYLVLELGTSYRQIRSEFLKVLEGLNLKAKGFGDLKAEEVSRLLKLGRTEAELAKRREYDEPFYFLERVGEDRVKSAEREFQKRGLNLTTGGRLFHLTGDNDKGKAVRLLGQMYKSKWGSDPLTIGLGDSLNDLPLLESVDIPVLMGNKDGSCEQSIEEKLEVRRAEGIGPRAWNRAVLDLIDRHELKAC